MFTYMSLSERLYLPAAMLGRRQLQLPHRVAQGTTAAPWSLHSAGHLHYDGLVQERRNSIANALESFLH